MALVRVDLHVHTSASHDCSVPPEDVYRRAKRLGLGPVVITDHDTIQGALQLKAAHPDDVVVGQEISTSRGELMGLFLEGAVPAGLDPVRTAERIREQGGLVCLQHPFDIRRARLPLEVIERLAELVDVVEVYNARSDEKANQEAEDLRETLGVPGGAGSDAHFMPEIGVASVELEAFTTPQQFLANLAEGRILRRALPVWSRLQAQLRGSL